MKEIIEIYIRKFNLLYLGYQGLLIKINYLMFSNLKELNDNKFYCKINIYNYYLVMKR